MSNALRIDSINSSDHDDYLVVSEHRHGGLSFMVVDQNDDTDNFDSISILTNRSNVRDLISFLAAWLEKSGGQP